MNTEIKTLSAETVKNIVNAIKGGTITKVTYTSAPSLTAQSKKAGVKITKVTSKLCRLGLDYEAMKEIREYKATHETSQYDYSSWENDEDGRIVYVPKTNNTLVRIYKLPNHSNTKSYYIITDEKGTRAVEEMSEEEKAYITPSYFKAPNPNAPYIPTQKINIENFIEINGVEA